MKVQIVRIADRGSVNLERIHLTVLVDTNLCFFAILKTSYVTGNKAIVTTPTYTHWFPSHPVKAGDQVVLYTSGGTATSTLRPDGHTDHFFFWGSPTAIFN